MKMANNVWGSGWLSWQRQSKSVHATQTPSGQKSFGMPFKRGVTREKVGKTRFAFEFGPPGIRYGIPSTRHMDFVERSHCGRGHKEKVIAGTCPLSPNLVFIFTHLHCIFASPDFFCLFLFHGFALFLISPFKPHSQIIIRLKKLNVLQIWRFSSMIDVCEKQMIWWW